MQNLDLLCFKKLKVWELNKLPPEAKERLEKENIQNICGTTVTDILAKYNVVTKSLDYIGEIREKNPFFRYLYNRDCFLIHINAFSKNPDVKFPPMPYMMYYEEQDPSTKFTSDYADYHDFPWRGFFSRE